MGWSDLGDGCYYGDGPSDAVSSGLGAIGQESIERTGMLPSGKALLEALVHALNLDGALAPFYDESRRIEALVIQQGQRRVRIDGRSAEPWLVAEMHSLLDEVAEEYTTSWNRAPRLRELLPYFRYDLEEEEGFRERISDAVPWSSARRGSS